MQFTRVVAIGAVLAGSGLVVVAPAHADPLSYAAHVQFVGNTLTVTARPGFANRIEIDYLVPEFKVHDSSGPIQPGVGCKDAQTPNAVICGGQNDSVVNVFGGDLDDVLGVRGTSLQTTTVNGGDGPDNLESDFGGTLNGERGDDWLNSKAYADTMNGGEGFDTVNYNNSSHTFNPVMADADGQSGDDGQVGEGDTIGTDVEAINGGGGADYLIGNASDNVLNGGRGNDVLDGGLGADVMIGGPDTDEAFYGSRTAGVMVTLDRGTPSGEPGEGDTIGNDVENARGGSGNDRLVGNTVRNVLIGGPGQDQLFGLDGDDTLSGGPGFDGLDGGAGVEDICSLGPDSASHRNCEILVR